MPPSESPLTTIALELFLPGPGATQRSSIDPSLFAGNSFQASTSSATVVTPPAGLRNSMAKLMIANQVRGSPTSNDDVFPGKEIRYRRLFTIRYDLAFESRPTRFGRSLFGNRDELPIIRVR